MANYNTLKSAIEQVVKTNGNNEITGALLQQSLLAMINSLGAGYQFAGVAVPATNPGTPDYNVFYFAGPGTYPNFNNATIPARNVGLLSYNGTWHVSSVQTTPFSAETIVNDIIQLYDGETPVFPRAKAEGVIFYSDPAKTLGVEFGKSLQDYGIGNKLTIIGNNNYNVGNNGENPLFGVEAGASYRVFIVNKDVDMSGVTTTGQSRFAIWVLKSNNSTQTLVNVLIGSELNDYYDVVMPSDAVAMFVSGRCTLGEKLKVFVRLKGDWGKVFSPVEAAEISNWDNGYYIPTLSVGQTIDITNKIEHSQFQCAVVECTAGQAFSVSNHNSGGTARAWAFIDANNVVLQLAESGATYSHQIIYAPAGSAKVVFNNNKNGTGYWLKYYYVLDNQFNPDYLQSFATKQYVEDAIGGQSPNTVDLLMFMGQSNMAGRGVTNAQHPEGFPIIINNAGYEFRAISDPTKLYPIAEPFGVNENKSGGINDGSMKTGSGVVAFVNSYYLESGVSVVGVSASKGGTTISEWQPNGILLPDAIQRLTDAVQFLTANNYTIRHKYMVWLQGESDGDISTTKENYISMFNTMFAAMKNAGIEKCLLIRIGNHRDTEQYATIIDAETTICKDDEDVIMVSTALSDFRRLGYMKDYYHYYQDGYNRIGRIAGHNAGVFARYGIERMQYDSENPNNIYLSYKCN